MLDKAKKYLIKIQLRNKQRVVDKLYAHDGLTDEVLDKQIEINTLRCEHDIPDKNEFIHGKFVQ